MAIWNSGTNAGVFPHDMLTGSTVACGGGGCGGTASNILGVCGGGGGTTWFSTTNSSITQSATTTAIAVNSVTTFTTTMSDAVCVQVHALVEEEEYVNNLEYWEAARARGVLFTVRTAEERRRAEEAAVESRRQEDLRRLERIAAEQKAKDLLLQHLTPEQRETMEKHGWFVVVGGRSRKTYRIKTNSGYQHNILEMRDDKPVYDLCCHLKGTVPKYDHFLGQKLYLEHDEDEFIRIANRRAA